MYNQYFFGFLWYEEENYYIVKQSLQTGNKIQNLLIRYLKRKTQINVRVKTHFLQNSYSNKEKISSIYVTTLHSI